MEFAGLEADWFYFCLIYDISKPGHLLENFWGQKLELLGRVIMAASVL